MSFVIIMHKVIIHLIAYITLSLLLTTPVFAQNTTPLLKVVSPSEGQTLYANTIPILLSIENFQLVDHQINKFVKTGQGHIHLWLDDTNPTPESAVKSINNEFTFNDVSYGIHTLRAELVNNNHTSLNPSVVATVTFTNEQVGSPALVATSGFDKNTALVILVVVALVIIAAWWYTKEEEEEKPEPKRQKSKPKVKKPTKRRKSK